MTTMTEQRPGDVWRDSRDGEEVMVLKGRAVCVLVPAGLSSNVGEIVWRNLEEPGWLLVRRRVEGGQEKAEPQWVRELRARAERGEVRAGDRLQHSDGRRARVVETRGRDIVCRLRYGTPMQISATHPGWRIVGERVGWVVYEGPDNGRGWWSGGSTWTGNPRLATVLKSRTDCLGSIGATGKWPSAAILRARVRYLPGCSPKRAAAEPRAFWSASKVRAFLRSIADSALLDEVERRLGGTIVLKPATAFAGEFGDARRA